MRVIIRNFSYLIAIFSSSAFAQISDPAWSGYIVNSAAQFVQAGWTVPSVRTPTPGYSTTGYASSTWVGLGGTGTGTLIQAGTAQKVSSTGIASYYFWYEIFSSVSGYSGVAETQIPISVHPGDFVAAVVTFSNGQVQFGAFNYTTGEFPPAIVLNGVPAPSASAEWIVESQSSGALPNFGSVTFENMCWASSLNTPINCGSTTGATLVYDWVYVLGGYQTIASPGPISGDSFTDYYYQPHIQR
ncbi:G1 family glutamic endopeptidase [Rudaea cellulosilytica]|uniref:G1 family glutamic endopeptidase n=1 Tax=Rudaea cellulosilytica TaxID=540746 RepID=UPI0009FBC733|nr:G1 family glutamic endopeptidase [Rudaea cellulosilytica]